VRRKSPEPGVSSERRMSRVPSRHETGATTAYGCFIASSPSRNGGEIEARQIPELRNLWVCQDSRKIIRRIMSTAPESDLRYTKLHASPATEIPRQH
jgi:hypothetical protein